MLSGLHILESIQFFKIIFSKEFFLWMMAVAAKCYKNVNFAFREKTQKILKKIFFVKLQPNIQRIERFNDKIKIICLQEQRII